jgi:AcrR family transcriptional regulator
MASATPPPQDRPDTLGEDPSQEPAPSKARNLLEHSLVLLWEGRPSTAKGPKPTLNLEQIVDPAVEIADADGVDGLSMRRLARELGVGTMSLYRYIPDKSVLLDLMLDRVSDPAQHEHDLSARSWREVLRLVAWEGRSLYLRHPWLLQVNWTRPVLGPNSVAGLEVVMAGLADLAFSDREKIMVMSALDAYANGMVRQQIMYENAAEETGIGEEEFWGAQLPTLERAMASGNYPTMAAMAEDSFEGGWEETFALGLGHLLDGIAADVERRTGSS